jgi:hypothetical protein
VQLKLGTRHRKYSLHKIGRDIVESTSYFVQSSVKLKQKVHSCSDLGRVTGECWELVGPCICKEVNIKEERRSTNCTEDT